MDRGTQKDYEARVVRVLGYIQRHLDDELTLDALASLAHFSPYHFHRIFRGMVGESIMEHVRRLRLERAALRLKFGEEPIASLGVQAGYQSPEAFSRAFRNHFGASPSDFRRTQRALPYAGTGVHYSDGDIEHFEPITTTGAPMEITIEKLDEQRVAYIRHNGPYEEVGPTWQKLMSWAWPRGLVGPQSKSLGVSYDDPDVTAPEKIRYDACVTVGPDVEAEGDVQVQTIAGGCYAKAVHTGPYESFSDTYVRILGQELPRLGYEPRSEPCVELYLNNPQSTPPEKLVTEIFVPVVEK